MPASSHFPYPREMAELLIEIMDFYTTDVIIAPSGEGDDDIATWGVGIVRNDYVDGQASNGSIATRGAQSRVTWFSYSQCAYPTLPQFPCYA